MFYHYIISAVEKRKYTPPGKLIAVGEQRLHIYGKGKGSPTVVFDSGHGLSSYTNWSLIQPEISKISRTCIYDRAGYGWSDSNTKPRTSAQMVEELRTLLSNSGEEAPYILVAHSLSALNACLYASKYPHEVAGIVIVDGGTAQFYNQFKIAPLIRIMVLAKYLRILGLVRIFGELRLIPTLNLVGKYIAHEHKKLDKALFYRHIYNNSMLGEMTSLGESIEQVSTVESLGDIPLVVITSGQNAKNIKNWREGHEALLRLSTKKTHIIAEDASHFIHLEQPETVIGAIKKLLDETV
jgi:pimeloyl-ACP methyl ester carboxylesterase